MKNLFRSRPSEALPGGILALQLTAILLLLQPGSIWYVRPPLLVLASLGLLYPAILRTPATWAAITLLAAAKVVRVWHLADNHHYLLVYWALAVFLALLAPRPDDFLRRSARWLVAFVFVWATIWKGLLSPDYLDGRFYRVRLLTDARFAPIVSFVGGLSPEEMAETRIYLQPVPNGGDENALPRSHEPRALRRLATVLTWGTLFIEGAVALAFLLPWGRWTAVVRHGTLLGFCATAYAIAPVAGFGWILAITGLAQVPEDQVRLRLAYVGVWFLILFYQYVPWTRLLP